MIVVVLGLRGDKYSALLGLWCNAININLSSVKFQVSFIYYFEIKCLILIIDTEKNNCKIH